MARPSLQRRQADEQLELFEANLREVSPKVDLASLEHPLFSISRRPLKVTRCYALGRDCEIKIVPAAEGAPTVEDKDILVYCASQLRAALNAGLKVPGRGDARRRPVRDRRRLGRGACRVFDSARGDRGGASRAWSFRA